MRKNKIHGSALMHQRDTFEQQVASSLIASVAGVVLFFVPHFTAVSLAMRGLFSDAAMAQHEARKGKDAEFAGSMKN